MEEERSPVRLLLKQRFIEKETIQQNSYRTTKEKKKLARTRCDVTDPLISAITANKIIEVFKVYLPTYYP